MMSACQPSSPSLAVRISSTLKTLIACLVLSDSGSVRRVCMVAGCTLALISIVSATPSFHLPPSQNPSPMRLIVRSTLPVKRNLGFVLILSVLRLPSYLMTRRTYQLACLNQWVIKPLQSNSGVTVRGVIKSQHCFLQGVYEYRTSFVHSLGNIAVMVGIHGYPLHRCVNVPTPLEFIHIPHPHERSRRGWNSPGEHTGSFMSKLVPISYLSHLEIIVIVAVPLICKPPNLNVMVLICRKFLFQLFPSLPIRCNFHMDTPQQVRP